VSYNKAAALELHAFHDGTTRGKNVTAERAAAKLINSVPPKMRRQAAAAWDGMLGWDARMGCYRMLQYSLFIPYVRIVDPTDLLRNRGFRDGRQNTGC